MFDSESRSVRLCFGGFDNLTMGNSQGKPVVFTDEGERAPAKGMRWFLSMRFVCGRSWRGAVVSTFLGQFFLIHIRSQPQPFPPLARRRQGLFRESSNRGAERFGPDIRIEVYSERRR